MNDKIFELEARIERLEELLISVIDHDLRSMLYNELLLYLNDQSRTYSPEHLSQRINRIQATWEQQ